MKNKLFMTIVTVMLFLPWTILIFRTYDWALQSPIAEMMIACYAVFMIFSGLFTIFVYIKEKLQNTLMKLGLVINSIYATAGVVFLAMMVNTYLQA